MTSTLVKAGALALAAGALVWRLGGAGDPSSFERPVLLVSGRDDHGMLASETVDLLEAPEGSPVGAVRDGTLVQVLDERSTWLEVRTLEGDRELTGWVDDFHLRGTAHLVGEAPACPVPVYGDAGEGVLAVLEPSAQVALKDHHVGADGRTWVVVEPLAGGDLAFVPREVVRELAGPAPRPGVSCELVRPDPEARPHHH